MKWFQTAGLLAAFYIAACGIPGCSAPSYVQVGVHYVNPPWAPPYHNGVRYYYLPDIEVYYDLSEEEFVYLNNGQWLFSSALPPIYAGYDIYNGFVIVLNTGVYQPWMHHQYYVAHYPRYYYRNSFHHEDWANIRGFNENGREPVYWLPRDKSKIDELRKTEVQRPERKTLVQKLPQNTNYYGKVIGVPVKVRPQMREIKPRKKGPSGK